MSVCRKEREQTEPFPFGVWRQFSSAACASTLHSTQKAAIFQLLSSTQIYLMKRSKIPKGFDPEDPNIERKERRFQNALI